MCEACVKIVETPFLGLRPDADVDLTEKPLH